MALSTARPSLPQPLMKFGFALYHDQDRAIGNIGVRASFVAASSSDHRRFSLALKAASRKARAMSLFVLCVRIGRVGWPASFCRSLSPTQSLDFPRRPLGRFSLPCSKGREFIAGIWCAHDSLASRVRTLNSRRVPRLCMADGGWSNPRSQRAISAILAWCRLWCDGVNYPLPEADRSSRRRGPGRAWRGEPRRWIRSR